MIWKESTQSITDAQRFNSRWADSPRLSPLSANSIAHSSRSRQVRKLPLTLSPLPLPGARVYVHVHMERAAARSRRGAELPPGGHGGPDGQWRGGHRPQRIESVEGGRRYILYYSTSYFIIYIM